MKKTGQTMTFRIFLAMLIEVVAVERASVLAMAARVAVISVMALTVAAMPPLIPE
jgi:hypothetical protein